VGDPDLNLDAQWADLERPARADAGHLRSRLPIDAPVHVYIAVVEPSGCRVLVMAFDDDMDVGALRAIRLRGLEVTASPFDLEGLRSSVALATRSPAYNDIFARLTEDLISSMAGAQSSGGLVDAVHARLRHWQRFLEEADPSGLSVEAQAGLFGELWFLRDRLLPMLGPSAVTAWQGPLRAIQDFQARDWAIEVKTTRQAAPAGVRIANERQLQADGLATLALALVALEQRVDGSPTLVDIVASVRGRLKPGTIVAAELEDRLLSAGYHDEQAELYVGNGFALRWDLCSLVTDDFPKITEHDLPHGIGDVSYSVSLDACREHEIDFPHLSQLITQGPE
jgi:Putative  PD-(D/E)XK family member, (DUF4420)